MSVAMTNCGALGWVTDRKGYRYDSLDRETQTPWPPMPKPFMQLAQSAAALAGFPDFVPDACLITSGKLLEKARAEGYDFDLLSKPVHPADLMAKLRV